jgi:Tfp pilus assembly protein PilX
MNAARTAIRDERGVAVVTALVALMSLSALVLAFLVMARNEPQISRNLANATRARYVAEAGLEAAYDTLVSNTDWDSLLGGATCAQGAVMGSQNRTLPGLTAASGTFTVRVRNDCGGAADSLMTGVTAEPAANAQDDTNDHVILVSTGTFGTATKTITTVVSRVANVTSPGAPGNGALNAALSFPGYESDTSFTGNSFEVDGRNRDLNGNLVPGTPAMLGISVGPEDQFVPQGGPVMHHEQSVQTSLSSQQKDNVIGKHQGNPSNITIGDNTIAAGALTSQAITDFVNAVEGFADITVNSSPSSTTTTVHATGTSTTASGPALFNNVGASCGGSYNAGDCWGTPDNPKIVVIKGTVDKTSQFTALDVRGTSSGYGILIVEDGDLALRGNFHWEGPVIVTGGYVGVGFMGGGYQDVLGALVSNETASNEATGFYEGVLQGNAKVRYSRDALDKALALLSRKIPGTGGTAYVSVRMYNFREQ